MRHEAFVLHFMRTGAALCGLVVVGWLARLWWLERRAEARPTRQGRRRP